MTTNPTYGCPYVEDWGDDPAAKIAEHLELHHDLTKPADETLWTHYQSLCFAASEATGIDADYIDLRVEDMLAEGLGDNKVPENGDRVEGV